MQTLKVEVMKSRRGNMVKNHFIVHTPYGQYFQSYGKICAFIPVSESNKILLDVNYWDISLTTRKHLETFLGIDIEAAKNLINRGKAELVDLNESFPSHVKIL